jgi:hypothetical protein
LFIIPANGDTLRVSGKGQILNDSALQSEMTVNSKAHPCSVVAVEEVCAKFEKGEI